MRTLGMFAAGLVALSFGLAQSDAVAQDKKPISFWFGKAGPENQAHLQSLLIDAFNEAHPDQDLTIDFRGEALAKQLRVALLAGEGPDIVYTSGPSYVASMARAGQLLPLDDYAASFGWDQRILHVFFDLGRYDGRLYALPKTYETLGLFYNKTLFDKNSWTVPTTTDELEALADKMLAKGIVPFAAGNADWRPTNEHYVTIALNSVAGPDNVYKALTGQIPWTAEPFVAAIDKLNSWWQKGYFGPNYFSLTSEQAFAQVATGEAGMSPTGTWNFENIAPYFPAEQCRGGLRRLPSAPSVGAPVYALGIGTTFPSPRLRRTLTAQPRCSTTSSPTSSTATSIRPGRASGTRRFAISRRSRCRPTCFPSTLVRWRIWLAPSTRANTATRPWTFLPPATDTYLVSGIEEVWLGRPPPPSS